MAYATYAAYWVMHQAIEAAPGFIAKPIDIAVLRRDRKDWKAEFVSTDQKALYEEQGKGANKHLKDALLRQRSVEPPATPTPELLAPDPEA